MTEIKEQKNYFSAKELGCKCGCNTNNFDSEFLLKLNAIREECGFSFVLTSAYRCKNHPIEARKTRPGSHNAGKAVDVRCSGEKALDVLRVALKHGIERIGVQQKAGSQKFVHLDACNNDEGFSCPYIWSY